MGSIGSDEIARFVRQDLDAVLAHDGNVFKTNAKATGEIDAGLDGKDHTFFKHRIGACRDIGMLMDVDAKAMAGPMQEILAIPGLGDRRAGRIIHGTGPNARFRCGNGRLDCAFNDFGNGFIAFRLGPEIARARHVAGISALATAQIDHQRHALFEAGFATVMVRESSVGTKTDTGKFGGRAVGGKEVINEPDDLQLGHAYLQVGEGCRDTGVGQQGILLELTVFRLVLAAAQIAKGFAQKLAFRRRQGIEQQQGEVGAHGLIDRDRDPVPIEAEVGQHGLKGILRTVGIHPTVEGQVRVLTNAVLIEGRHQESRMIPGDQNHDRALVTMRGNTCQPGHIRRRTNSNEIGSNLGHPRPESRQTRRIDVFRGLAHRGSLHFVIHVNKIEKIRALRHISCRQLKYNWYCLCITIELSFHPEKAGPVGFLDKSWEKYMDSTIFTCCMPALMTPCKEDRTPDYDALVKQGKEMIDVGMGAVVYCGSMGDWPLLTDEQRMKGVEVLVEAGLPVVAGLGAMNTKMAAAHAAHAQKVGAKGLMIIPRQLSRTSVASAQKAHFEAVLSAAPDLPGVIYNSPYYGFATRADLFFALRKTHPNLVGFKEFGGPAALSYAAENMTSSDGDDALLMVGVDTAVFHGYVNCGAQGAITGIGNILPKEVLLMIALCQKAVEGDLEARRLALELESALAVLSKFDEMPDLVLSFKYMMVLRGKPEYTLNFNESDVLSESQMGFIAKQLKLFDDWYANWSTQPSLAPYLG